MLILAHRANRSGPQSVVENSVEACRERLQEGFGLEIDVRRDASRGDYLSHDPEPRSDATALAAYAPHFAAHPDAPIGVNVKELHWLDGLAELLRTQTFGRNAFAFDFELLEPDHPGRGQRQMVDLGVPESQLAVRISDRDEPIDQALALPGHWVWADEFQKSWIDASVVTRLKESGRKVIVVSPELHGRDGEARTQRWETFRTLPIDGICTDYPIEAQQFFG